MSAMHEEVHERTRRQQEPRQPRKKSRGIVDEEHQREDCNEDRKHRHGKPPGTAMLAMGIHRSVP
jgi:hypothetical protein